MMAEEEAIPLSALQHAVYCIRQAALIHLERLWEENIFTAEGQTLHALVDKGGRRKIRGLRRVMSLPLACQRLNLVGVADVVEFQLGPKGEVACPVEYKRGKPKLHRADEVQLCAQALCLEEMTGLPVPEGALFYAQTKRRVTVPFDNELRHLTEETVNALINVFKSRITPAPTPHKVRCQKCSLIEICRPQTYGRPVQVWRDMMLSKGLAEE